MSVQRSILPSGVRVVSERLPGVRSAAVGAWVGTGSRHERPTEAGISHLVEHLLFKGTERFSAQEISERIEATGGEINAFTTREETCYHATVPSDRLEVALDLLGQMLTAPLLDPEHLEMEKQVVLDEISMYEDDSEELVQDLILEATLGLNGLSRGVLGRASTLRRLGRPQVERYMAERYTADNLVVAAAGQVEHEWLCRQVEHRFASLPAKRHDLPTSVRANPEPGTVIRRREAEQVHLCLGVPGLPREHDDQYALAVLETLVGGGTSSHLFQELREKRGLVYSTYAYHAGFAETGVFVLYAGCRPSNLEPVSEMLRAELDRLSHGEVDRAEVERAREQLRGAYLLGSEGSVNRMFQLGQGELLLGRVVEQEEYLEELNRVNLRQVRRLARQLFQPERVGMAVAGAPPRGWAVRLEGRGPARTRIRRPRRR
ncbi:M16 family metallopeptidase [Limnochorda pilosa]|uniref:Zinc protease n=1 Tax=Limnochorda pilosa TaxID=1555112 RepID=A0A0K2SNI8_LIMPI|nr:pitrilysin family protein [Limnochorda pilosa]BAS28404.1 zinc protease [Limnochorda pilosa]